MKEDNIKDALINMSNSIDNLRKGLKEMTDMFDILIDTLEEYTDELRSNEQSENCN